MCQMCNDLQTRIYNEIYKQDDDRFSESARRAAIENAYDQLVKYLTKIALEEEP